MICRHRYVDVFWVRSTDLKGVLGVLGVWGVWAHGQPSCLHTCDNILQGGGQYSEPSSLGLVSGADMGMQTAGAAAQVCVHLYVVTYVAVASQHVRMLVDGSAA